MRRETLLDFFDDLAETRGVFLAHDNGYRRREHTYQDVARAARALAARLHNAGLRKGDAVAIWSENRPEWIAGLWGCLLQGIVAVPIDYRASPDFLARVATIVKARLVLAGEDVPVAQLPPGIEIWPLDHLDWLDHTEVPRAPVVRTDTAEIIFTSGATAEPKGVVITHGNVLANIVPVEREIRKYRKYARPFSPIRFLNLLPLSHMFGQSMATFVPPLLGGTVLFIRGYNPNDIVRHIKARRVSVLVSVPKILDVLREHARRIAPDVDLPAPQGEHPARRWWRYRAIHKTFGLKFWSFIVGAAPLDPEVEAFWRRLGFAVIQGYGLTETAPIVTLNHPFRTSQGSVGTAIAGVEVRIAPDGEILVRGENVTTGYVGGGAAAAEAFEDGWFHTGDIGEVDAERRLFIKGRKKEMIVTPEGLNVFPEDVERALLAVTGVKDAAVVGVTTGSEERVHAVVILEAGVDPQDVVRAVNLTLLDHQKVRGISIWSGSELPRTDGTRKLRRREIRDWVATGTAPARTASATASVASVVSRFAGGRDVSGATTLDELGLSSLERVELMVALEETLGTTIDEGAFSTAATIGALEQVAAQGVRATDAPEEGVVFPTWNRGLAARIVRRVNLPTWLLPLARVFAWIRVEGLEHLEHLEGPVIFAANHQSHMDAPAILCALPSRWRYRVAIAMAKEFFQAHFFPAQFGRRAWLTNSLNYYLAALVFNAFPLPQREAGARQTLRYMGELASDRWSVLIFPEGRRNEDGQVSDFRPGVGMIASRLGLPVIPVRLDGLERILPPGARMARPGRVRVAFGAPLTLEGDDYPELARRVERAVRSL